MNKFIKAALTLSLFGISSFSSFALLAQAGDPIGRVLVSTGSVQAQSDSGTRALRRGTQLFEADRVITGPNGFAQVRMVDNAIITLKEDTEFAFTQYAYDDNPNTGDSAVMELVRGGFRTISGSISDEEADTYEVITPFASIGVRGTIHEAVISFDTLFTGVYDGGTTVSNDFGQIDTGLGGDFDYTQTTQGQPPRGLLRQPNQLGRINVNPGAAAAGEDEGEGEGDGDGDNNQGGANGQNDQEDGGNQNGNGDEEEAPNFENLGNDGNTGDNNPPATPPAGNNNNGGVTNTGANVDTTPPPGGNTDQAINPTQNVQKREDIQNAGQGPTGITDSDGDGVADSLDAFPNNPLESRDSDGDGVGDNADAFPNNSAEAFDADGDGVGDNADAFPNDPNETLDSDGDGIGDNADPEPNGPGSLIDSDGDGIPDAQDAFPNNPDESVDSDGDGVGDNADAFPNDPNESVDSDGDGIGDNADPEPDVPAGIIDTDGDGIPDDEDAFPNDPDESVDADGDGVGDNADPAPNDPTIPVDPEEEEEEEEEEELPPPPPPIVAVLNPAQINAILTGGRRGFTLSRNFYQAFDGGDEPAIFFGPSSNAASGNPVIMADSVDIAGVNNEITGDFIFDSLGSVNSSNLGFTNGITSFYEEFVHDVQWGLWGNDQALRVYNDVTDNSVFYNDFSAGPLLWVSAIPTDIAPMIGSSEIHMFMGDQEFIGSSSAGGLTELLTWFNLDFYDGSIYDGHMEFCLGDCSLSAQNSQFWEFNFDGDTVDNTVFATPSSNASITFRDTTGGKVTEVTSINGVIDGFFTGDLLEAFVGGVSLYSSPIISSELSSARVDGVFLLEREDRLNSTELGLSSDSLLVQEGYGHNLMGYGLMTAENTNNILFIDDETRYVYRASTAGGQVIDQVNQSISVNDYGVTWERWDGPLVSYLNNYDENINFDQYMQGMRDTAFFASFQPSNANNLRGHFSNVIGFIGQGDLGTAISNLDMGFDVDFQMGSISNGFLNIEVGSPNEKWVVYFNSISNAIKDNKITNINILANDGNGNLTRLEQDGLPDVTTIAGNINLAFVDNTTAANEWEQAFVSSFNFEDTSEPVATRQTIQGLSLVAGEVENRFDFDVETDLTRLGMLLPTQTTAGVLSALATSNAASPLFVENNIYVEGPSPFVPLDPFSTTYVVKNIAAGTTTNLNFGPYDIALGKWQINAAGDVVIYNDNINTFDITEPMSDLYWASVGTVPLETPWSYGGNPQLTFSKVIGLQGSSNAGTINVVEALFEINFDTGNIDFGEIVLCTGGDCNASGSQEFEIQFTDGTFRDGYFEAATINSINIDGIPSAVTGSVSGIFTGKVTGEAPNETTGDLYDVFVGGFNFTEDNNPGNFLSGNFVLERDDRVNGTLLNGLDYDALIVDIAEGEGSTNFFEANPAAGLTPFPEWFVSEDAIELDLVIKSANIDGTSTTESGSVSAVGGFQLDWAQWQNAFFEYDNLIIGHNENQNGFKSAPLLWSIYNGDRPPEDLIGTYSNTSHFIGGEGTLSDPVNTINNTLTAMNVEFLVNMSAGSISEGTFSATTSGDTSWNLDGLIGSIDHENIFFDIPNSETPGVFGTYDDGATMHDITFHDITGAFVDRGAWINFEHGEGILMGFALESSPGDAFLNGLVLNDIGAYSSIDLRYFDMPGFPFVDNNGIPIDGIPDSFVDLGFILASDHGSVPITNSGTFTHEFVFPSLVAFENDSVTPVFAEVNTAMLTSPPEPDVVFRRNGAAQFSQPASPTYSNVEWGYWNSSESDQSVAFISEDLTSFEAGFERLYWALVTAPGSTAPNGVYTYAKRVSDFSLTQSDGDNLITDIFATFDIDFALANNNVTNGFIRVCTDGSNGCDNANRWEATFDGDLDYGYLQTGGSINTGILYPIDAEPTNFTGDVNGVFTAYENYSDPYDVFVGGFNFDETGGDGFASGLFLLERDDRLDPGYISGKANVFRDFQDDTAKAIMVSSDGTLIANLKSSSTLVTDDIIYFLDEGSEELFALPDVIEHGISGKVDVATDPAFQLGYWDTDPVPVYDDNLDASQTFGVTLPLAWANVNKPESEFDFLTGIFNSSLGYSVQGKSDGSDLTYLKMHFRLDFGTGNVSDGFFETGIDGCDCFYPDFWFEGELSGNVSTLATNGFTVTQGQYIESTGSGNSSLLPPKALGTQKISGEFTGDPENDEAWFAGVFLLETADTTAKAIGSYAIASFMEDRLTTIELEALEDNVALLINQTDESVTPGFSTNSNANSPKVAYKANFFDQLYLETGTPGQWNDISDEIRYELTNQLDKVIVENGPQSTNLQTNPTFNVGWGYWDTGADKMIDNTDGSNVNVQGFTSDPLYWLSAEPTDVANLTGEWSYSNVSGFIGTDQAGMALTSVDMMFNVDFGTGAVTSGFLNVVSDTGLWNSTFSGGIDGAYFDAASVSGTLNGTPGVGGDVKGVFVGTGANHGFASGFTLHDGQGETVGGAALLDTRVLIPQIQVPTP